MMGRIAMVRSSTPMRLPDVRCPTCGRFLGRMALEGNSAVELKCRSCRRVTTFVPVSGPAPSRSDTAP